MSVPPDPKGSYDAGLSAKKALNQTLMSNLALVAAFLTTLLASPDLMAQVMAAVAKYPKMSAWVVGFFSVARFGLAFWRDYQKHQDVAYHVEHGVPPVEAEALAVASGADPVEARKETEEAVADQAVDASKASVAALGRWHDRAIARAAEPPAPAPVPVVVKILKKIIPKRKKKVKTS